MLHSTRADAGPKPTPDDYARFPHLKPRRGNCGPVTEGQNVDGLHYLECAGCGLRRTYAWKPADDDRRP